MFLFPAVSAAAVVAVDGVVVVCAWAMPAGHPSTIDPQ